MIAESLAELPPALILTAACDVLVDEGLEYARRLSFAEVPPASSLRGYDPCFLDYGGELDTAHDAFRDIECGLRMIVGVTQSS
jgi:acetyl esterase